MSDRTYARDVGSTGFPRTGLPDDPNLEMRIAAPRPSDDPEPPSSAALFPEIVTWKDDQLLVSIELADRREPALRLHATDATSDLYDAFLDACSAELVRRLEAQGVRMAA